MAETHGSKGQEKPETLNIKPSHVKVESTGHVTITDPQVAQLLQRKIGAGHGALQDDGVSVGVVVSKSF
jgi:hypothetical protein